MASKDWKMSLVKTIEDTDYSDIVKSVYGLVRDGFGYKARVTRLWDILLFIFNKKEFDILDVKNNQNGTFEAYLLDSYKDWIDKKPVNFKEIYDAMLVNGDFTSSELLMFKSYNIEEILWGIYLSISKPDLNFIL